MTQKIAIGIPTFRRNEALLRRIDEIASICPNVNEVIVNDNDPESSVVDRLLAHRIADRLRYVKNISNVGACANFVKIVELARADSLWFRGDDDAIHAGVVKLVEDSLCAGAEIVIFTSLKCNSFIGTGVADFCGSEYAIRASRWLSAVVVPVRKAQACLEFGYFGVASGWPHVTLLLGILQKFPETKFSLVSYAGAADGFRDVGRGEGMKYAYFKTGIEYFPHTASVISDHNLRRRYLHNWRGAFDAKMLKAIVRMRLGYMAQEAISIKTIWPLLDYRRPLLLFIVVCLFAMAKCPRSFLRAACALYFNYCPDERRNALGFDFLIGVRSPRLIYCLLRDNASLGKAQVIY